MDLDLDGPSIRKKIRWLNSLRDTWDSNIVLLKDLEVLIVFEYIYFSAILIYFCNPEDGEHISVHLHHTQILI